MSLPYMPGWWDEISKNATSLVGQLPQMIQPDRVANKRLQDMVQQNPMLLEQFSNMDEGTRNMLAQSLGFKNENPIAKLPVGAQRQERESTQKMIAGLDAQGQEEYKANKLGILTPNKRKKETQDIRQGEQAIAQNDLVNEINTFKIKDIKKASADLDAAIAQFPDLSKVDYKSMVRDFVRQGKPLNSMLMLATDANPGAKMVLDLGIKVELQKLEAEQRAALSRAKDPNTKQVYLRTLTEMGNQFNDQEQRLMQERAQASQLLAKDNNYMLMQMRAKNDPAAAAAVQAREAQAFGNIDSRIQSIREAAQVNRDRLNSMSEQVGAQEGIKQPAAETPEQRKARLRKLAGLK